MMHITSVSEARVPSTVTSPEKLSFPVKSVRNIPGATLKSMLIPMRDSATRESWKELTLPERRDALMSAKSESQAALKSELAKPKTWQPEVDAIHLNILHNLLVKYGNAYADHENGGTIKGILSDPSTAKQKGVVIARGTPAAGKTTFLKGVFSLAADNIKVMLKERMPGLTSQQVHFQSTALLQMFEKAVKEKIPQAITIDALYITNDAVSDKMKSAVENGQKVSIHDIQVDLKSLCCRMLKRGADEPRMNFDFLSGTYKRSLENRSGTISLVNENKKHVEGFSLSLWDPEAGCNVKLAEFKPDMDGVKILNKELYSKVTNPNIDDIDKEISSTQNLQIDDEFIRTFTSSMPDSIKSEFTEALNAYRGFTLKKALDMHMTKVSTEPSLGTRVIEKAISD